VIAVGDVRLTVYKELKVLRGYKKGLAYASVSKRTEVPFAENVALPPSVDWREKGVLTAVKDQGECGSCWTFATAESVEAYYALATGNLLDLSEQQVLDCTPNPNECGGTGGCQGGTTEIVRKYLIYCQLTILGLHPTQQARWNDL
jgi:cathepsin L